MKCDVCEHQDYRLLEFDAMFF